MAAHNELGRTAEQHACEYLRKIGYAILETNWRIGHKEVDIIARDRNELVFVEVKARKTTYWGDPVEAVNYSKIRNLTQAANSYVKIHNMDIGVRFDIISIISPYPGKYELEHLKDAFTAPLKTYR